MLDIRADFRPLVRRLDDVAKRQVPFAAATALTETARVAAGAVTRQLPSIFDKPTPFTMRAIAVEPARKGKLEARVFVRDRQAEYLMVQETGGTKAPKNKAFVLPRAIRTNQYGNLPKNAVAQARARKGVFSGAVEGVAGLYQKVKGAAPKLLALYVHKATYKPRFGFQARVQKVASATLAVAFRQSLAKALATARR